MNQANHDFIQGGLEIASTLASKFLSERKNIELIAEAISIMTSSLMNGGKVISCGNGGSMCDSMHFAEELTGRFYKDRPPIAAMAISDPGYISCTANDFGYSEIFQRQLEALGRGGDTLLAISTSGNSINVLKAVTMAHEKGMKAIALIGKDGGKLKDISDLSIIVDHNRPERIQEMHIKIIHIIVEGIERNLYPELY